MLEWNLHELPDEIKHGSPDFDLVFDHVYNQLQIYLCINELQELYLYILMIIIISKLKAMPSVQREIAKRHECLYIRGKKIQSARLETFAVDFENSKI